MPPPDQHLKMSKTVVNDPIPAQQKTFPSASAGLFNFAKANVSMPTYSTKIVTMVNNKPAKHVSIGVSISSNTASQRC